MPHRRLVQPAAQRGPEVAPARAGFTQFVDFVIHAQRETVRSVAVGVYASPAGSMPEPAHVSFTAAEAERIHESFRSTGRVGQSGRLKITQAEATELGRRLALVLFPAPVFRLLSQSLSQVVRNQGCGLRIRLALDESLIDLPWEYTFRPDRVHRRGISGFLLLDPGISMVREPANPRIALEPISGLQRLAFIGTLWQGGVDGWKVKPEFEQLRTALRPVSRYISADFMPSSDDAFGNNLRRETAVFHYSGHCDFDKQGRAYLVHEVPTASLKTARFLSSGSANYSATGTFQKASKTYVDELAAVLNKSRTRLAVMSACNSGFWPVVKPLLNAAIPAVIGINGAVASASTTKFFGTLYESLGIGLTLDEAVDRARLRVLEWGQQHGLFDWGLYMVYMPSPQSALFPRTHTKKVAERQREARREHRKTIDSTLRLVRALDGMNFGEIMSELTKRRVLILGRFSARRLKVLQTIKRQLAEHPNHYLPELFIFKRPEYRDLVESIIGFASLSRFIVADLSEPRSVQAELEAIVHNLLSVPVVPIISRTGREYSTFSSIQRRENVIKPTVRYRDLDDLMEKLEDAVVPMAEAKLKEVVPRV